VQYSCTYVNVEKFLITDAQHVMHHYQVGILKKMGCYSVKMIIGQNMENLARIVDRYGGVNNHNLYCMDLNPHLPGWAAQFLSWGFD
jgi:hypothetical protein